MLITIYTIPKIMTSVLSIQSPACGRWSAFAALAESDDELDITPVSVSVSDRIMDSIPSSSSSFSERLYDPLLEIMSDRQFQWGWIADAEAELGLDKVTFSYAEEEVTTWDSMLHDGWDVVEVLPGYYSTRNLRDDEFERLMTWLYSTGWEVSIQSRALNIISCHHCNTSNEARQWSWAELDDDTVQAEAEPETEAPETEAPEPEAPEERYAVPKNACSNCGTHHWRNKTPCPTSKNAPKLSKPGTDIGLRDGAPVPRFCNLGKMCPKPGCRYVHGDTIPRLNAPCRFADSCSGDKRANCIHMHPGEKFVAGMVLHRLPKKV